MDKGDLIFRVAGPENLEEALHLREAVYERDRGYLPNDQLEDLAKHFVAIASSRVVGYLRLLGPETRPFDLEASVDLRDLLGPDARPALVGRLCIHPSYRRIGKSLPIGTGLLSFILCYAGQHKITDLLLYTYDDLRNFYRAARFVDTNITFHHRDWGKVRLMRRRLGVGKKRLT